MSELEQFMEWLGRHPIVEGFFFCLASTALAGVLGLLYFLFSYPF